MKEIQPSFARGMATFREECNYYPLKSMEKALKIMCKNAPFYSLPSVQACLKTVTSEIAVFERLYCIDAVEEASEAVKHARLSDWDIRVVRRDAERVLKELNADLDQLSDRAVAERLKKFMRGHTGRPLPSQDVFMGWTEGWNVEKYTKVSF
jgi:hypothetical protein